MAGFSARLKNIAKTLFRHGGLIYTPIAILAFFAPMTPSASADGNIVVTEPTDFWFTFAEPTQFLAQTYQSDGFESDPQLWLYS